MDNIPRQCQCVIAVSLTAKTKRLETLDEEESSEGIQCGTYVAQEFDTELHRKCNRSKRFAKDQPVITLRRGRERREFSTASPVKLA